MILGGSELSQGEGVNLLTVHASKGLEFLEVYVMRLYGWKISKHQTNEQGRGTRRREKIILCRSDQGQRETLSLFGTI